MAERRQQVEELFHAALARSPEERSSFLSEACSSDPALRDEVESLISAHEKPGSFLDSPAYEQTAELIEGAHAYSLIGTTVGHYEVLELIGRGGMGDVYLAKDQVLGRKVALKLLPQQFTADEIRLRRFIQEAKSASSLNHPNIITIHQIGHTASVHFIATEFVAGRTLRKYVAAGAMPVKQTIDVAIQVTSALAASHAAGIVHRDIKPENVMIRPDGYVKVLDFGLAKLTETHVPFTEGILSTGGRFDTDPGTVMGTTRYMSPEQARGVDVDGRSDIFNVGILLYEMLTGKLPFDGDTTADVITSILKSEPAPLGELATDASPEMIRIVSKALSKDKEARYQTSEDLLSELKSVQQELEIEKRSGAIAAASSPSPGKSGDAWWWLAAALVVVVVSAGFWILKGRDHGNIAGRRQQSTQESLHTAQVTSWRNAPGESPAAPKFSPIGDLISYSAIRGGNQEQLWVQKIGGGDPMQVTTNEFGAFNPIWSQDGERLAFLSQHNDQIAIGVITYPGGAETWLTKIKEGRPSLIHWSKDGGTIFYEMNGNLFALDPASGQTRKLTEFDPSDQSPKNFSLSPDEKQIAYQLKTGGQSDIWVATSNGENRLQITDDVAVDRNPHWLPDSQRIIYNSDRDGASQICVAFVDRKLPAQITRGEGAFEISDISAAGQVLYTGLRDGSYIWSVNTQSGEENELTTNLDVSLWPDVSPDGKTILFQTAGRQNAQYDIFHSNIVTKGSGEPTQTAVASDGYDAHWVANIGRISFLRLSDSNSVANIWTVNANGADQRQITTAGVNITGYAQMPYARVQAGYGWSPDGSRIAYCSNRSGLPNVWVISTTGGIEENISHNDDRSRSFADPIWSPDGTRIAFLTLARGPANADLKWSISLAEAGQPLRTVVSSPYHLRLLGWSDSGSSLLVAESTGVTRIVAPAADLVILRIRFTDGRSEPILRLDATYSSSLSLSPDGRMVLFTSRRNGRDNIWISPAGGGRPKKVTANNDPNIYYSSPAWSPDAKMIYFGRQEKWSLVSVIDNFK
jgi:eukaryotic-like serine/threonine-protein kinase